MIQKMQRTLALSFSAVSLVTFLTATSPTPAHAMTVATFFVGLGKTMVNMAQEPFEILLLPVEIMKEDKTPSVNTNPAPGTATSTTSTTTTTTKP
jgi:hypothetical protein